MLPTFAALAIMGLSGLGVGLLIGASWNRAHFLQGFHEGEISGFTDGYWRAMRSRRGEGEANVEN